MKNCGESACTKVGVDAILRIATLLACIAVFLTLTTMPRDCAWAEPEQAQPEAEGSALSATPSDLEAGLEAPKPDGGLDNDEDESELGEGQSDLEEPEPGPSFDTKAFDGVESFVYRLYTLVLEREPDKKGFQDQCAGLRAGISGSDIAANFFCSPEFQARALTNGQRVELAYAALLDRRPDEKGLADWVGAMDSGMTIRGIVHGFAQSAEFNALCARWGINVGSPISVEPRDTNFKVTRFVYRLYSLVLERKPDLSGLNHWCSQYFLGLSTRSMAQGFFGSAEFSSRGLNVLEKTEIAYRTLLDREYDLGGRSMWAHCLRNGMGIDQLVDGFCKSEEYLGLCARMGMNSGANEAAVPDASSYVSFGPTDFSVSAGSSSVGSTLMARSPKLFLASNADISNITLVFWDYVNSGAMYCSASPNGPFVRFRSGDTLDVNAMGLSREGNAYVLYVKDDESGTACSKVCIMKSSGVLTMYISSDDPQNYGREWLESDYSHSLKASATMTLVAPDGAVRYGSESAGSAITIKGRGNTTWAWSDKKPYQISLSKKTDLLDTGDKSNKAKKWILLANACDPTLLRNTVSYAMALEMGLSCAPQFQPVDLYYDGQYRGSYLLGEKVEVGSGRIDIEDLDDRNEDANPDVDLGSLPWRMAKNKYGQEFRYVEGVKSPGDISGGYLLEMDSIYYKQEACWFTISTGQVVVVKSPEFASYEQMRYISEHFQEGIQAIVDGGTNSITQQHVSSYFDLDSFAKMYVMNEVSKDLDGFSTSSYFYKDAGDDLLYSTVWDFDSAYGLRDDSYYGWATNAAPRNEYLGSCIRDCSAIMHVVKNTYCYNLRPILLNVVLANGNASQGAIKSIDAYVAGLRDSVTMDSAIWGYKHLWDVSIGKSHV